MPQRNTILGIYVRWTLLLAALIAVAVGGMLALAHFDIAAPLGLGGSFAIGLLYLDMESRARD